MIQVAKIGKSVGVYGGLKLHLLTDFPEIFHQNLSFIAQSKGLHPQKLELKIKSYTQGIVVFEGYESKESAKMLTNFFLYATLEDTQKHCLLQEGEAFWFDVIGEEIVEEGEILGKVIEIERIAALDYLIIQAVQTHEKKLPKRFMLPYIDRYILKREHHKIYTQGAKAIWYAS